MNKQELINQLTAHHQSFVQYLQSLPNDECMFAPAGKWNAAQQLDHMVKSVHPLLMAYSLPRFIPVMLYGTNNRTPKSYDELVNKYLQKIQEGGKATGKFIPPNVQPDQKLTLCKKLNSHIIKLNASIGRWKEADLDRIIFPHPLIGKITAREMLYFTIYHVQHHHQLITEMLTNKKT